jgi:hypothetical protein
MSSNYASDIPTAGDTAHDIETIYRAVRADYGHDLAADVAVSVLSGSTPADAFRDAIRARDNAFRAMRRRPMPQDEDGAIDQVADGADVPFDVQTGEPLADCVLSRLPEHTQTTAQYLADGLSVEETSRRQQITACGVRYHRRAIRAVLVESILDGLIGVER